MKIWDFNKNNCQVRNQHKILIFATKNREWCLSKFEKLKTFWKIKFMFLKFKMRLSLNLNFIMFIVTLLMNESHPLKSKLLFKVRLIIFVYLRQDSSPALSLSLKFRSSVEEFLCTKMKLIGKSEKNEKTTTKTNERVTQLPRRRLFMLLHEVTFYTNISSVIARNDEDDYE